MNRSERPNDCEYAWENVHQEKERNKPSRLPTAQATPCMRPGKISETGNRDHSLYGNEKRRDIRRHRPSAKNENHECPAKRETQCGKGSTPESNNSNRPFVAEHTVIACTDGFHLAHSRDGYLHGSSL